jgi:hypothetical protein
MTTDTEIKASKELAKNGYGQNNYQGPSSLLPGQTKSGPTSPIGNVSPGQGKVESLRPENQLSARVRMDENGKAAAYPTHNGFAARTASSGSPGGTVPAVGAGIRKDSGMSLSPSTFGRKQ